MEISARKSYFIEEDDGLASIAEVEAGVSSQNAAVSSPFCYTRRNTLRNMNYLNFYPQGYYQHQYSVSSPRSVVSGRFHDSRFENSCYSHQQPHYLESCTMCKKPLVKIDIYMYRGDIPFCSEECRQEQIDRDEAVEKKKRVSSSMKAMRRKEQSSSASSSPNRSPDYSFKAGTVAAA
ncbi:PREDICTED: uncharacterized protein LOC104812823 [Tarenaya hassleriana]|uniref:uncharacterized protein LOC104812823 n=1 Tax=Tarenaya hassleriana TaxID=28532 RepID=UPI00053C54C4|nr:PREDICTED: uncharacterized protein LOC104812823 [Tarenaya hassleriana]